MYIFALYKRYTNASKIRKKRQLWQNKSYYLPKFAHRLRQLSRSAAPHSNAAALERDGVTYLGESVSNGFMPKVETVGNYRVLTQRLTDRVALRINRETDTVSLLIDGQEAMTQKEVTLKQWGDILYSLRHLYDKLNS